MHKKIEKVVNEIVFKTSWAEFSVWEEEDGQLYESHRGYDKGCFWTEPQYVGFAPMVSVEDIKKDFIEFYGKYKA